MIFEFWEYEKYHGKKASACEVSVTGDSREWIFCNDPKNQRMCHCQKCGTKIPREVPRIKLEASYFYGSGYYCLTCGKQKLDEKYSNLNARKQEIEKTMDNLTKMMDISKEVMSDQWYSKKMALGRMLQVMEENQKNSQST